MVVVGPHGSGRGGEKGYGFDGVRLVMNVVRRMWRWYTRVVGIYR